jgi:acyl-CoA thioesterase FadM
MLRQAKIRVLNDTSLFDSMQLQLRPILTVGMRCWAQWAHDNLYSFSTLIKEHRFGLVVVGGHVKFERPFDFFSADAFDVVGHAEVVQDRRLIIGHMSFMNGDEQFLSLRLLCRPVTMVGGSSFAALPTKLEGAMLAKFTPEEVTDRKIRREVVELLADYGPERLIAEAVKPERLYRHDCEAADQWSYIEIGSHAAIAREAMIVDAPKELRPKLQAGLATSVRHVDIEIKRPLFLFDKTQIRSQVYLHEDRLTFVHTFQSQMGGRHDHAIVVERF